MPFPIPETERYLTKPSFMKSPGWLGELLLFGITVFSVSLILWAGLKFGYETYLSSQIQKLNGDIQKFNQQISADDRAKLVTFYSQLQNLKTLLNKHTLLTPVFMWLENSTLPQVSYARLSYSPETAQLALNGVARTPSDLTTQLKIFENAPGVSKVSFNNITSSATGTWAFDLIILFNASFTVGSTPLQNQTP